MLTITVEKSEGSRTSLKALVSSSKINSEFVLFQVNAEESWRLKVSIRIIQNYLA